MAKYKTINGWTKAQMIEHIEKYVPKTKPCQIDGTCVYRNKKGERCAVGAFLPRAAGEFRGLFSYEGIIDYLINAYPTLESKLPLLPNALSILQRVHDRRDPSHIDFNPKDKRGPRQACIDWIENNVIDSDAE